MSPANLSSSSWTEQHRFGVPAAPGAARERTPVGNRRPHQADHNRDADPAHTGAVVVCRSRRVGDRRTATGKKTSRDRCVPETHRDDIIGACACRLRRRPTGLLGLSADEESETLELQIATDTYEGITRPLPDIKISFKLREAPEIRREEKIMAAFKAGQVLLMVATTVIEVGVDVPNASLMIIRNAERLGLSQLRISCAGASGAARARATAYCCTSRRSAT